jgi:ABC-type nickel/cobalt efflux system permease component RcnA
VQALAAIVIVTTVLYLIGGAVSATRSAAGILESASYALIGALGLYLVWTAFRPAPVHAHHDHHHHHDEHCGHAHAPEPKALRQDWSLTKACSMAFAIGIRPCTGAILVLLAAYPLGLYWAGVLSVFAMAAGTFLTVSLIAAITVYSKHLALRFAGPGGPAVRWLDFSLRFGAGVLVAFLGGALFWASLGANALPG